MRRLLEVRQEKGGIIFQLGELQNAPELFGEEFLRDFYRAMLTNTARNAIRKIPIVLLCGLALFPAHAAGALTKLNLVIAVDLTKSVAVRGPDGKSEFQKNLDAVTKILAELPADTQLTIIGITDASFSQPYIIFSAKVAGDPGYFGERLRLARIELVRSWRNRSGRLKPSFTHTDILGAINLASQIFEEESTDKKDLVIYSDMRNSTSELDLETPETIARSAQQSILQRKIKPLNRIQVFALGVDNAGKSQRYWQSLSTHFNVSTYEASNRQRGRCPFR